MISLSLLSFVLAVLLGAALVVLALRKQRSSLPLTVAHVGFVAAGLTLLLRYIINAPAPTPRTYNLAALLFVMALLGGLVLLALRMGRREFSSPPPMVVVVMHAVMGLAALLLLAVGYTHATQ